MRFAVRGVPSGGRDSIVPISPLVSSICRSSGRNAGPSQTVHTLAHVQLLQEGRDSVLLGLDAQDSPRSESQAFLSTQTKEKGYAAFAAAITFAYDSTGNIESAFTPNCSSTPLAVTASLRLCKAVIAARTSLIVTSDFGDSGSFVG